MTEAEWLACEDPRHMLKFLLGRSTSRQLRLFACACVRSIWQFLSDPAGREAVERSEAYADGTLSREGLAEARRRAADARAVCCDQFPHAEQVSVDAAHASLVQRDAIDAAKSCAAKAAVVAAREASLGAGHAAGLHHAVATLSAAELADNAAFLLAESTGRKPEELRQRNLLWDIFGNPFRPVSIDPAWRTRNVLDLARTIYEDRELPSGHFDLTRLAILADALLDAGCESDDILAHCRSEGPHVRGCWVIDLLLGKE